MFLFEYLILKECGNFEIRFVCIFGFPQKVHPYL